MGGVSVRKRLVVKRREERSYCEGGSVHLVVLVGLGLVLINAVCLMIMTEIVMMVLMFFRRWSQTLTESGELFFFLSFSIA